MRNLFLTLWKYHFLILFLLLEICAGYLVIQQNNFQRADYVNSSNIVVGNILAVKDEITGYFSLKPKNKILVRENAMLRSLAAEAFYRNTALSHEVIDSIRSQQYTFVAAKVLKNSYNRRNNYLTLDKGSLQGIKPEMGVISSTGIVGIVKDVSLHFCSVMSVLHKNFRTSVRLSDNNYFGNLSWEGYDPTSAIVTQFPAHIRVKKGDTLFTTLSSTIFPDGLPVAIVNNAEQKAGESFQTLTVTLTTDYRGIGYAYIVRNLLKGEQDMLEQRSYTNSEDQE